MKRMIALLAASAAMAWAQSPISPDPTKNVELTVYLLTGEQSAASDDVPADLASTVKTLHGLFVYKGYKLTESFILRGRTSLTSGRGGQSASTEGVLPGSGLHYRFAYTRVRVSEKPYMVHIDGLSIFLTRTGTTMTPSGPKNESSTVSSISTDLDLNDGQKIVVGKSSINTTGDALILVVVPKVIE